MRRESRASSIAASAKPLHVAYNDGPPEISFCGRTWRIGIAQQVTEDEWHAMRERADFHEFDFRPAINGASLTEKE